VADRAGLAGVVSLTAVRSGSIPNAFGVARTFDGCANFAAGIGFNGVSDSSVYNEKKQSSDSAGTDG
jgi:hypothetical protein